MRILQVCTPSEVGGLERVVQGLALGLSRAGHDVQVVAVHSPGDDVAPFAAPLLDTGVSVRRIELSSRDYLGERRRIRDLMRDYNPDVVHTHGYRADLLHGDVIRRLGAGSVSTLHGSSRMGGLSHFFEWCQERALRRFDGVIAVSTRLRDDLRACGVPDVALHLLPNAIVDDGAEPLSRELAREELGLERDAFVFGWVGRLIPIKGADIFIQALLTPGLEHTQAVIIGHGPDRQSLESLVQSLGLENRVRFTGARADARILMRAFDVFVLSSRSEGTPMVVLEAMRAALPIVATDVGGVAELVQGVADRWIVPAESPKRLGEALCDAASDASVRQWAGAEGAARVRERYSFDGWIDKHVAIYQEASERRENLALGRSVQT